MIVSSILAAPAAPPAPTKPAPSKPQAPKPSTPKPVPAPLPKERPCREPGPGYCPIKTPG